MTETERILRQIQRAAGLDPDGPRLVPMAPPQRREDIDRAVEAATRDAMLRRAIGCAGPKYA
jgi:hypothetical protein